MATRERTVTDRTTVMGRSPLQLAAAAVGVVFLLVGVLGFVPGVTTNFDSMTFADHESGAMLLGIFQVNALHNIVHILFGVVGLAMATTWVQSKWFLLWGGAVYLALWAYGLVINLDSMANFVALNTADNWLHLGLGIAMVLLGYLVPTAERS